MKCKLDIICSTSIVKSSKSFDTACLGTRGKHVGMLLVITLIHPTVEVEISLLESFFTKFVNLTNRFLIGLEPVVVLRVLFIINNSFRQA